MRLSLSMLSRGAAVAAVAAAGAICAPGIASAVPSGGFSLSTFSFTTVPASDIGPGTTSVTMPVSLTAGAATGALVNIGSTASITPATINVTTGSIPLETLTTGDYTFMFGQEQKAGASSSGTFGTPSYEGSLTLRFTGLLTSDTSHTITTPETASMQLVFSQTGTSAFALAGTVAIPSSFNISVPEPASVAVLGVGLLGFGVARRKRA